MVKRKRALVTGIAGQDGSYLAELLLAKGYEVFGLIRPVDRRAMPNLTGIRSRLRFVSGDLLDERSLLRAVRRSQPDEVYNLAAQSFQPEAWRRPVYTMDVNALGVARLLETLRQLRPKARLFQASSSELFGRGQRAPQDERTPFKPRTPYDVAKLAAHWMVACYRSAYGMYAVSGILFNHESPRRGPEFLTRKVAAAAARIKLGLQETLELGTLDARRDWGYAGDYVEAMWLMLQQDEPRDFVLATGRQHSVQDFVQAAFSHVGLDCRRYVRVDNSLVRPPEAGTILGNPAAARRLLGWKPRTSFRRMVYAMVDAELELNRKQVRSGQARRGAGKTR